MYLCVLVVTVVVVRGDEIKQFFAASAEKKFRGGDEM